MYICVKISLGGWVIYKCINDIRSPTSNELEIFGHLTLLNSAYSDRQGLVVQEFSEGGITYNYNLIRDQERRPLANVRTWFQDQESIRVKLRAQVLIYLEVIF